MIDIVYLLGSGSLLKDLEIRMSLRSAEKYLTNYDKVYVVGGKPDWLLTEHIPADDDKTKVPDYNMMAKMKLACESPSISEDFLLFHDDHFLNGPFDAVTFPYFYSGMLDTYVKTRGLDGYGRRANNTLQHLITNNLPLKYFDTHTPIRINKALFLKYVANLDWSKKDGYIIKSLYANALKEEGVEEEDRKINQPPQPKIKVFSSYPHMKASVTRYLQEQFPEKSKFERTGI